MVIINNSNLQKIKLLFTAVMLAVVLSACGGGEDVQSRQQFTITAGVTGCGAIDNINDDQRAFCTEVWSKSELQNNCATCHTTQEPTFMHEDLIQAYAAIGPHVDRTNPANSNIVSKVFGTGAPGDGHNCWASDEVCADLMTTYIENWVSSIAGSSKTINLVAPTNPTMPGSGKEFPATATTSTGMPGYTFEELIYNPILVPYCSSCHKPNGSPLQGDPLFADPNNLASSYEAAKSKIDLDSPASSRLSVKLPTQNHNCFTVNLAEFPTFNPADYPTFNTDSECEQNATIIADAITKFAEGITTNAIDPNVYVVSNAMTIPDGIIASGGSRFEASQIALYEFKWDDAGQTVAYDTSAVGEALNLTLSGNVSWVGGWGVKISGDGYLQGTTTRSAKIHDMITATGAYSIEAWVAPDNVTQMDSRIVSMSRTTTERNFSLGQTLYNYDFLGRNTNTDLNGIEALSTVDGEEALQATLQHVVATYDPTNGRQIYVNGVKRSQDDAVGMGSSLGNWETGHTLVLGNEIAGAGNTGLWRGTLKMVSIHNQALTADQINQNLAAGVGEKFFLLFGISHIAGVPAQSYIMFEVSQFDDYSYLFINPQFVSLDQGLTSFNIPIKGMRIGINSNESPVGQAYINIDTTITANNQSLSSIGTTIPLENGPATDEFFLTFEVLGSDTHVRPVVNYTAPAPTNDPATSDIGLRTFDEINATMSAMTGISPQTVSTGYTNIKQQLPVVETIDGFLPAHQIAITQLAMEYCDALVNDTTARAAYFPAFNFSDTALNAFNSNAKQDAVIDPLLSRINGFNMDLQADLGSGGTTFLRGGSDPAASDPDTYTTKSELVYLINNLACPACADTTAQTAKVVKATCTAALASAITLIQ